MPANYQKPAPPMPASPHNTAKYTNKDGSKFITVPKGTASDSSQPSTPIATKPSNTPVAPVLAANDSLTPVVNRKKQKRRQKAAAKAAADYAANGHASPHDGLDRLSDEYEIVPSDEDDVEYVLAQDAQPVPDTNGDALDPKGKKNKKKKKKGASGNAAGDEQLSPVPIAVTPRGSGMSRDKIWSTSNHEERERIKEFWLGLGEEDRRSLVKVEKDAVLKKMKEQQKHTCSCTVCGRKRTAIEEELEGLYDAYYLELEQFANQGEGPPMLPPRDFPLRAPRGLPSGYARQPLSRARIVEHVGEDEEEELEDAYSEDEVEEDDYSDDEPPEDLHSSNDRDVADFLTFGNSLQVKGGILTVADDLLKNDGKRFIEMMEQLAERRMAREEDAREHFARSYGHPNGSYSTPHNPPPPPAATTAAAAAAAAAEEEEYEEEEEEEEEEDYDDSQDEEYEEDEEDQMTEEQRMEEGRRMFQIFAARMFEQRVLTAYKEKVAKERQDRLLEELEEEDRQVVEQKAKRAKNAQKKKDKAAQKKQALAEEKARKEAEKQAEEEARKEAELKLKEEQRLKSEAKRKQKEAQKKAEEDARLKREAERHRRAHEQKEKQAEQERKVRETKEREKRLKEEQRLREKEAREQREREAQERREKQERDKREKESRLARARKEALEAAEARERERAREERAAQAQRTPSKLSTQSQTQTLTPTPTQTPTQTQTLPSRVPLAQVPISVSPSQVPSQAPSQSCPLAQLQAQSQAQTPSQTSSQASSQAPSLASSQAQAHTPTQAPSQVQAPQTMAKRSQQHLGTVPAALPQHASANPTTAFASPKIPVATPVIPKAPTPIRPRTTSSYQEASQAQSSSSQSVSASVSISASGPSQDTSPHYPLTPALASPGALAQERNVSTGTLPAMPPMPLSVTPPGVGLLNKSPPGLSGLFSMPTMGIHPPPGLAPQPAPPPGFANRITPDPMSAFGGFRPSPGPNMMAAPGMGASLGRGFSSVPMAPPGFSQPPNEPFASLGRGFPGSEERTFVTHRRQSSLSFDSMQRNNIVTSPTGTSSTSGTTTTATTSASATTANTQPFGRPTPIGRPGSLAAGRSFDEGGDTTHLGSRALLGDAEPLRMDMSPGSVRAARGPRNSFATSSFMDPAFPMSHNPWGPPTAAPQPFAPPAFGNPGWGLPAALPGFQVGSPGSGMGSIRASSQPRHVTLRLMLCQACKDLKTVETADAEGYVGLATIKAYIDAQLGDPSILKEDLLNLCDTEGSNTNGGGTFDVKRDLSGFEKHSVRWVADRKDGLNRHFRAIGAPVEIGSPLMSQASLRGI